MLSFKVMKQTMDSNDIRSSMGSCRWSDGLTKGDGLLKGLVEREREREREREINWVLRWLWFLPFDLSLNTCLSSVLKMERMGGFVMGREPAPKINHTS